MESSKPQSTSVFASALQLGCLLFCLLVQAVSAQAEPKDFDKDFSVYLVKTHITMLDLKTVSLRSVVLEDVPLFTIDDVISYSKSTHHIALTERAFDNFLAAGSGRPFAVCIGRKPVYLGFTWRDISSQAFDGVVALPFVRTDHTICIQVGYPIADRLDVKDPRANQAVFVSIARHGKLKE